MNIALITEGTYPFHHGGVSVWCDQLVRDLSEHRFDVYAITASGSEQAAWELPANVASVTAVPLWARKRARPVSRAKAARFLDAYGRFLDSLAIESEEADFVESLQELAEFGRTGELTAAMSGRDPVERLLTSPPAVSSRGTAHGATTVLSVADAVDVTSLLEHFLRPLGTPIPVADVNHSVANGIGGLVAMAAKWSNGTPFLLTEHGLYLRERYLSFKPGSLGQPAREIVLRFFRLLVEAAYRHADVIAPGSDYNQAWELANGADPGRIRPVHNGVDPSQFPVLAVEPAVPTLSWIGRIHPLKDVETLLNAFAAVHDAVPTSRLLVFGSAPEGSEQYLQDCIELASSLGLGEAARFEGRASSPVEAYHAGHVVLLTSISEGLPYTVIEAMACGRPVVATDVGGVAEALRGAGVLVPPRNPGAVAAACTRLLADPGLCRALGQAARRRVLASFTAERCFAEYRSLYADLANSPAPAESPRSPEAVDTSLVTPVTVDQATTP